MNEKILQGVLIAVIISGSGYLVYSFVVPISDVPGVVEVITTKGDAETGELADWQTYRNEELGFKIKYPSTWYISENDLGVAFYPLDPTKPENYYVEHFDLTIRKQDTRTSGEALDSERQSQRWIDPATEENQCGQRISTTVGPHNALKLICYEAVNGKPVHISFLDTPGGALVFQYEDWGLESSAEYEEILSTFKFIE